MGLRGIPEAEIIFEDMAVPADAWIATARLAPRLCRSDECL
jgi:alkylation response protein AidB-like acyl-CoA dehydrogenase